MSLTKKSLPFVFLSRLAIGKSIFKNINTLFVNKSLTVSSQRIDKNTTITVTKNVSVI